MTYIIGLLDPNDTSAFKKRTEVSDGPAIAEAVRFLCNAMGWQPTEHYDNFYDAIQNTEPLDAGQYGLIELTGSGATGDLIIINSEYEVEILESWQAANE